ncbi:MAG: trigger factor [Acidobacteriota bacterium]
MKVEVAVAEASQCKKDLTIEVPAEEVKAEFDKSYQEFARYAKVPGFRPGHVPLTIVKQRFARDIKEGVLEHLLPHALQHAIVDNNLRVIGSPDISDVSVSDGQPLRFKATVEVLPDFDLKEYRGLKLKRMVVPVTEEDIDEVLGNMRESSARLVPVEDRPSQTGDTVSVNLIGKYVQPLEEEDLKADDVAIELGADGVQAEFNDSLTGVKADETREFRVVYAADFSSPGLTGKTIDFTASVVAVRRKELPAIDDEFARSVDGSETIGELREKVREGLSTNSAAATERHLRQGAIEEILSGYDFAVPDSLVEQQASELLRELAYEMFRNGVPRQSIKDLNWVERREEAQERAVRDVRAALVFERIGEAEEIDATDEEVDAEIERLAAASGDAVEAVRARLTKDEALSSIKNRLRHQKTLDAVIKSAEVTIEEVSKNQTEPGESPELPPQPDQSPEQA